MFVTTTKLLFLTVFLSCIATKCNSTEFVPVYMWETQQNVAEPTPALQRINENSFKTNLMEKLKTNPFIVVFSEETLSPEDFAQHDQSGATLFKNLHKYLESANVAYKPYVQNPIGAIKQLDKSVTEISLASLLRNFDVPKDDILVVDLNDAKDGEQRSHMLRRHDVAISKIFEKLAEGNDNILAIYTAHHTSWVIPEEVKHRNARSLLQESTNSVDAKSKDTRNDEKNVEKTESLPKDEPKNKTGKLITNSKYLLLHVTSTPLISEDGGQQFKPINLETTSVENQDGNITLQLTGDDETFTFVINFENNGYWVLTSVISGKSNNETQFLDISAPMGFSFHCYNVSFVDNKQILLLPGLQMQPFNGSKEDQVFGDQFNCVGFTSIPIWTGIFVTAILLLILTFGITLMMDIKTMDKFDDAKGKTITINAGE